MWLIQILRYKDKPSKWTLTVFEQTHNLIIHVGHKKATDQNNLCIFSYFIKYIKMNSAHDPINFINIPICRIIHDIVIWFRNMQIYVCKDLDGFV